MDDFKLKGDDTIKGLRALAQEPGELRWRLELLDKMQRIVDTQTYANRTIVASLTKLRREFSHLSLTKVAEIARKEIEADKQKVDSGKWRGITKSLLSHAITAAFSIGVALLLLKVKR